MNLVMLKAKIHRAKVTQCDLNYEGSITVDESLLEAAGIIPYEQVDVLNINSGARFTTYAITGERGSGIIGINGAAARLCQKDDLVIICAYAQMTEADAKIHTPTVVLVSGNNKPV
ncbi:MAG TPA: aspartate 1-decarboxylase [Alphaproteobacteria bacterium]|nr:aspartate 1-decarboxylase [Alphaproteobacteria bacterium]